MESVQKYIGKKVEIIDFDENIQDEMQRKSSEECSTESKSSSESDCDHKAKNNQKKKDIKIEEIREQKDHPNQKQRISWKEIQSKKTFLEDNNMMPFDIEESPTGGKYCKIDDIQEITPFSIFSLLLTDGFIRYMVFHTNLYADQIKNGTIPNRPHSRLNRFKLFTDKDIKTYIALILWMGIHSNKVIQDNWSYDILHETNFGKYLSYNRFLLIHRCFHLNDNETPDLNDPIYKLRPLFLFLLPAWQKHYRFSKRLTIDESMIKYNGRLSFKQYIMNKPVKWGIKAYTFCNSYNGYCYNIKVFCGKKTTPLSEKLSKSESIVLNFVTDDFGWKDFSGSMIYIDNYYMGPNLLHELSKCKIGCVGTAKKNRILSSSTSELPSKLEKGELKYYSNSPDNSLLLCIWQDRGTVRLLSNVHQPITTVVKETKLGSSKHFQKPEMAIEYVKYGKAVDLCNQLSTVYRYPHKSRKWWKTVFFHMLQITITNSYIMYREISNSKISHLEFYKIIVKNLLGEETRQSKEQQSANHNPDYIDDERKCGKRERCHECGKLTMYKCDTCRIGNKPMYLCVPKCFKICHP